MRFGEKEDPSFLFILLTAIDLINLDLVVLEAFLKIF